MAKKNETDEAVPGEAAARPAVPATAEGWATAKLGIPFDALGQIDYGAIGKEFHVTGTNRNHDAAVFSAMRAKLGGAVGKPMTEAEFDAAMKAAATTKFKG